MSLHTLDSCPLSGLFNLLLYNTLSIEIDAIRYLSFLIVVLHSLLTKDDFVTVLFDDGLSYNLPYYIYLGNMLVRIEKLCDFCIDKLELSLFWLFIGLYGWFEDIAL